VDRRGAADIQKNSIVRKGTGVVAIRRIEIRKMSAPKKGDEAVDIGGGKFEDLVGEKIWVGDGAKFAF